MLYPHAPNAGEGTIGPPPVVIPLQRDVYVQETAMERKNSLRTNLLRVMKNPANCSGSTLFKDHVYLQDKLAISSLPGDRSGQRSLRFTDNATCEQ